MLNRLASIFGEASLNNRLFSGRQPLGILWSVRQIPKNNP